MTGFQGTVIRGPIVNKSVEKLKEWLTKAKKRMEDDFEKSGKSK